MRQSHHGVFAQSRRAVGRSRAPLALGVMAALIAASGRADAQVGSVNVPLPNVLILLDTSGSFEHMIDGSNPEDTTAGPYNSSPYGNNNTSVSPQLLANCEDAWTAGVAAIPNRWGVEVQALTGSVLSADGTHPFSSCVTMDREYGTGKKGNGTNASLLQQGTGLDLQYGLRDELQNFYYPYDSGYYLPFHRPARAGTGVPRAHARPAWADAAVGRAREHGR